MARVFLFALYDPFAAGVRQLAACAKEAGHAVHMCFIKTSCLSDRFLMNEVKDGVMNADSIGLYRCYEGILHSQPALRGSITQAMLTALESPLQRFAPTIIGFSGRSWVTPEVEPVVKRLREKAPSALFIAGGAGPADEPELFLNMGFDLVVRGEGEGALLDICSCADQGRDYDDIMNVVYKKDGVLQYNPLRPLIDDLGTLPMPLWNERGETSFIEEDRLQDNDYSVSGREYQCLGSRGCFAKCSYCTTGNILHVYKKQGLKTLSYRAVPIENLMSELRIAKARGAQSVRLTDEYFVRPMNELIEFFTFYNNEIALPYRAYLNPSQLLESETYFTLAAKHLYFFGIGVQSGSDKFNREEFNRFGKVEDAIQVSHKVFEKRIISQSQLIGGLAIKTPEVFEADLAYVKKLPHLKGHVTPSTAINYFSFFPVPDTPLVRKHPFLETYKYAPLKYLYEAMLLHIRHLYAHDDDAFNEVRSRKDFVQAPFELYYHYHSLVVSAHREYLMEQAARLEGQEVYFWGMGQAYEYSKYLFANVRPKAMVLDKKWIPEKNKYNKDGIPFLSEEEAFGQRDLPPIIIFAKKYFVQIMANNLYRTHPELGDNIIGCSLTAENQLYYS